MTKTEMAQVYDTILSIPGMSDTVRIDLKLSRKNALLLNRVIERGLSLKQEEGDAHLLGMMPADTVQELNALAEDCLKKAGLIELSDKLKAFSSQQGK